MASTVARERRCVGRFRGASAGRGTGAECKSRECKSTLTLARMILIVGAGPTGLMLANQLGPEVKNLVGNADPTRADYGFGLGLAVRTTEGVVRMMGSVGDFSWPGASGTNWWADPREDMAVVWMAQSPGTIRWKYRQMINALVYQAIMD